MKITCSQCGFSREMPDEKVPDRPVKVTCPKCREVFLFDRNAAAEVETFFFEADESPIPPIPAAAPPELPEMTSPAAPVTEPEPATIPLETPPPSPRIVCPACGLDQEAGISCAGCGVVYAKWAARNQGGRTAVPPPLPAAPNAADLPKAGFWIRLAAALLDGLFLSLVQGILIALLGVLIGLMVSDFDSEGLFFMAIGWVFSLVTSLVYYVYFTASGGQTPGKMVVRIRVIRTSGDGLTYGRAFYRETICKFISGIIFGIGYLMIAFDSQKQGLHDKLADTYVVKN